jgi:GT2 family glycosyltransferase
VVICTVGRPTLLRGALDSLADCDPVPAEVVLVDQSDDLSSRLIAEESTLPSVRSIRNEGRGKGVALNAGLANATHDLVLITDDDCTVRPDWVAVAQRAMSENPEGMITGQVLPGGDDPSAVPSTIELDEPRDYTGQVHPGYLYGGNMACSRDALLDMGGFDDRSIPAPGTPVAADCDLCYRWLRAGRSLRHIPELVVVHHDWRSKSQMSRRYVEYHRASGMFYAKHLRAGDFGVLRFLVADCKAYAHSVYAGWFKGVPRWADYRRGMPAGLPRGLWAGWWEFRPKKAKG